MSRVAHRRPRLRRLRWYNIRGHLPCLLRRPINGAHRMVDDIRELPDNLGTRHGSIIHISLGGLGKSHGRTAAAWILKAQAWNGKRPESRRRALYFMDGVHRFLFYFLFVPSLSDSLPPDGGRSCGRQTQNYSKWYFFATPRDASGRRMLLCKSASAYTRTRTHTSRYCG